MSLASSQILSVPLPTVLEKSLGKLWEAIFSSAGQWTPAAPKLLSKTEQLRFHSLGMSRNVGLGVGGGLSSSNPPPNFPHPTSPPGGMCSGPKRAANSVSCCYSPQPHKDYIYKIWDLFFCITFWKQSSWALALALLIWPWQGYFRRAIYYYSTTSANYVSMRRGQCLQSYRHMGKNR